MSDKKNIDRLFQEKLKDFEAIPSNTVWENIAAEINPSNGRKKAIPVWWKIAGIAASLILLFSLGNMIFKTSEIVPEEKIVNTNSDNNKINPDGFNQNSNDSIKVDDNTDIANEELQKDNTISPVDLLNNPLKKSTTVVKNNIDKPKSFASNKKTINKQKIDALLINDKGLEKNTNNAVVENANNTGNQNNKTIDGIVDKTQINSGLDELKKADKTQNTDIASSTSPKKVTTTINNNTASDVTKDVDPINTDGLSITEVIAASNENNLEKENKEKIDRWKVTPVIAAIYFNTLGSGSSIDTEFANNSKSGDINMSYGISASYAINDKINVRVGVNNVKLGYNTHDVFYNSSSISIKPVATKGIEIDKNPAVLASVTIAGMSFSQVPEPLSNQFNASINQELGFLEIPLEIQYKIINTKLGVNLIGGFSALFLNNNEIFSTLEGNSTLVGKATNINNLSYSANLGLGLNYKVSNKINLNLEPVFKYQLNTFNNTSGNFKPYFIGVYTGFSFKF